VTTELRVEGLRAAAGGTEILHGIDLAVRSGEVHVIMGPNGSGKSTLSHVLMGRPGYEVLAGRVTLDGRDMLGLTPWERAQAGLFLALQYPTEVPGVPLEDMFTAALSAAGRSTTGIHDRMATEAARLGIDPAMLDRPLNVDLSGGEKKRNETLQLAVLRPRIAVLDELDSGLDIDALAACSRRIEELTNSDDLGVLAITHYNRLLHELRADRIHILIRGRIVTSGGPELAAELERDGYAGFAPDGDDGEAQGGGTLAGEAMAARPDDVSTDPFADPFAGRPEDPFGDPFAKPQA
jgi:Fe-S cluster assembly ATP-binding protein